MQPTINSSISFLVTLSVLCGLFVSDFRVGDAMEVAVALPVNNDAYFAKQVVLSPATSTPNIDTNWFSVSSSGMSYQLPAAQARKDDDDSRIAQGRIMGESFGSDADF